MKSLRREHQPLFLAEFAGDTTSPSYTLTRLYFIAFCVPWLLYVTIAILWTSSSHYVWTINVFFLVILSFAFVFCCGVR